MLPLLPKVPLHIHKMHFKVRIQPEYYQEIVLPVDPCNKGKEHQELIGLTLVKYRFYANGTIVVSTERAARIPSPWQLNLTLGNFMSFLGQIRDRLVLFIADKHERIVPNIMDWELTQCDLNRDVHLERWMLLPIGLSIQVRHLSHLFRVYIKIKGRDTVCRVEESVTPKGKSVVESVNDIFNPTERLEKQIANLTSKVDQFLVYCSNQDSMNYEVERNQFQSTVKGRSTN